MARMVRGPSPRRRRATAPHRSRQRRLDAYPTGLVACVSDSYDVFKACSEIWGETLRSKVLGREGTLVVRPDSGEPCATSLKCLELLYEKFGGPLARVGRLEVPSLGVVVGRPTRRRRDGRGDGVPVGSRSTRIASRRQRADEGGRRLATSAPVGATASFAQVR